MRKNSGCCEYDSDIRIASKERAGGGDTHLAEESMIARQYASISSRANVLWRHSSRRNCGRSPFPSRHKSPRMANASSVTGTSDRVVQPGRAIDSSLLASRSSDPLRRPCQRPVAAASAPP